MKKLLLIILFCCFSPFVQAKTIFHGFTFNEENTMIDILDECSNVLNNAGPSKIHPDIKAEMITQLNNSDVYKMSPSQVRDNDGLWAYVQNGKVYVHPIHPIKGSG